MKRIVSLSIALFTGLASTVRADLVPFEGQVLDLRSAPVHRAEVVLFNLDNPNSRVSTTTDESGSFSLSLNDLVLPRSNALGQNYPNPFNPSTLIPFEISEGGHVRLDVFNILGQRVVTLIDEPRRAGLYKAQWDATDAAGRPVGTGVYIYRLTTGNWQEARKLVLIDGPAGSPGGSGGNIEGEGARYGVEISGGGDHPGDLHLEPGHGLTGGGGDQREQRHSPRSRGFRDGLQSLLRDQPRLGHPGRFSVLTQNHDSSTSSEKPNELMPFFE